MFSLKKTHTYAAICKIISDLKRLVDVFTVGSNAIYILYLLYASIFVHTGMLAVNITLMVIIAAYTVFYILFKKNKNLLGKKGKRAVKHTYSISRIVIKTLTLGVALYAIATATSAVDGIAIILAVFSIMTWIFSLAVELLKFGFEHYSDYLMEEIARDIQPIKDTIQKINSFKEKSSDIIDTVTDTVVDAGAKIKSVFGGMFSRKKSSEMSDAANKMLESGDTADKN